MPNPPKAPVARLAGVVRPGEPRPMPEQDMPDHVAVLREGAEGWRSVPVAPGMALHDGDVVRLKGGHFGALGARAFTVGSPGFGDPFGAAPAALDLLPHEAVHTVQQGYGVVPLNDADAERIEREAEAAEALTPPKGPGGR
ncbi:hypothetical protein GXW77_19460 [Roseomonas alkaliterrae]|uniref:DUF4157 domain-containing protein n=1 Tax=Neoroseomonas alkaliterrae TaxID=1452450 RepID=A0A840Y656_9PROT|nr:hypothetical protein [Neoroseomonas alkaliterrae]MBB5691441.1 hypothetical protein [Neoroseomonas alkaliterrae]MBR0678352.1 hypothetical protein [Neoroseomonas alkaliterrae]